MKEYRVHKLRTGKAYHYFCSQLIVMNDQLQAIVCTILTQYLQTLC